MCWGKMALKILKKPSKIPSKFFIFILLLCCLKESNASRSGCNNALGMQRGKIKDSQLSAYSKDLGYGPTRGRLNGNKAWCGDNETPWTEYFQIVLDRVRHVSGIGTQGYSFLLGSYWVRSYAVRYSYDGSRWYWFKDQRSAATKQFDANTDANTEKRITLPDAFVTKYLRIYPITFNNDMCLRVELYGCPDNKGVDDVLLNKACPGSTLRLDCTSTSKSIKILHASYGYAPYSSLCGSSPTNTTCQASGVQNTVTSLCEHYKTCQMDVKSSQFGVSCETGVVPQLTVYYQCTGTVITTRPPPSTTTSAPSTTSPRSTTNTTPTPITDTTTTTTTPGQATSKPPIDPGSPPSTLASGTEERRSSTRPTSPGEKGGNKLARMKEDGNVGMVIGIVVALLVVVILVVILLCFLYRRRRYRKDSSVPGVTYTAAPVDQAPPRTGSSICRSNPYESVNVLYVSADEPCGKKDPCEHIYDSPELQEPLPKMTNNPLYHGASGLDDDFDEYESIDPPKEKPPLPPRSLDPSIYDSPIHERNVKPAKTSISNPNYDKAVIDISESQR